MSKSRFEHLLVTYCAPTLKQYKQANMFHIPKDDSIQSLVQIFNTELNPKGIYIVLIEQNDKYTIYVYNSKLIDYISSNQIRNFLNTYQYPSSFESCLNTLKKRLNNKDFPHEIGVFLGYPLCDVQGFIENRPYLCIGDWKVYQNEDDAKQKFILFKQTKEKMLSQIQTGQHLAQILQ